MSDIFGPNFSREEFACRCGCGFDTVDAELLEVLKQVRVHFNAVVRITSGCRCKERNHGEGGSPKSQHLYGRAADIQVEDVKPAEVAAYLETLIPDCGGIGIYSVWVHIDTREQRARW